MFSLTSLQGYLRFKARQHHETVSSPPFTLFFHTNDPGEDTNYAIPDTSQINGLPGSLMRLQTIFTERGRKPHLAFIEEVFPHLASTLRSSGWSKVGQAQIMICTPETYLPGPNISEVVITTLSHQSSLEEVREGLDTNALGFHPQAKCATIQEAEEFRQSLILSRAFTAHLHEQPVAAGMFTDIHEGLTELVGITTLEPFRRRGIATALTASITYTAFQSGATQVFLIAASEQAGRIYKRVGFHPHATQVVYKL